MLAPSSKWDNRVRSPSSIHHMQRELHQYIELEKSHIEDGDIEVLVNIMRTFNVCCDIIKDEENKLASMTTDGAQW